MNTRVIKISSVAGSGRLDIDVQFQVLQMLQKHGNIKGRKCDLKTKLPSDFSGCLLRVRTPQVSFPKSKRGCSNWSCLGGDYRSRQNFHGLLPASLPRALHTQ